MHYHLCKMMLSQSYRQWDWDKCCFHTPSCMGRKSQDRKLQHGRKCDVQFSVAMLCLALSAVWRLKLHIIFSAMLATYLSYVEATWFSTLPVELVGYLFSRHIYEECDLHWISVATVNPRLPARIPIAPQKECHVIVGYLGPPESMQQDFAVTWTARIKDADSVATVLWDKVLAAFCCWYPSRFYRHQVPSTS